MSFTLRPYHPDDAHHLLQLFQQTVRNVNNADYSPEQLEAWAPENLDPQPWIDRFEGHIAWVATEGTLAVGFSDMTTEGYIDRLFVSHQHQRQGIARALLTQLIDQALQLQLPKLTTEASLTARPFFEAMGFEVVCQQTVHCRGMDFVNFQMQRFLPESRPE